MSDTPRLTSSVPASGRDWTSDELEAALAAASAWTVRYRERVGEFPVFPPAVPGETQARLAPCPPREAESIERVLDDLDDIIVPGLTHWNHPGFFAYFSSSARGPSVVAELLIAGLGINAMLWRTSPSATELEIVVVDWLRQAVGLPDDFRGMILDTASTSSFTAALAARERSDPGSREAGVDPVNRPRLTTYVSDQAHSSVEKAIMAAGLGRQSVRRIASDEAFRMDVAALEAAIESDLELGARPMMICATLGTTSTASMDPIAEIAAVSERTGAWLHVDAAYAGAAAIVPGEREAFRGWEAADSIVINPHKWLGTSLDCSVLLFRDATPVKEALSLTPAYLSSDEDEVVNLMEMGLPLGRRFRALKLWLLFRCVGTDGLAAMLRTHIDWAREFATALDENPRFELMAPVGFSTVCFRAVAGDGDSHDEINRAIVQRVNRSGEVFISHTELHGSYTLRLSIGSVHTRARDVENALRRLEEAVDAELGDLGRSG